MIEDNRDLSKTRTSESLPPGRRVSRERGFDRSPIAMDIRTNDVKESGRMKERERLRLERPVLLSTHRCANLPPQTLAKDSNRWMPLARKRNQHPTFASDLYREHMANGRFFSARACRVHQQFQPLEDSRPFEETRRFFFFFQKCLVIDVPSVSGVLTRTAPLW